MIFMYKGGLFPVHFKGQRYDRNAVIADLGKRFEGINVGLKPWPACGLTHSYIGVTLKLVEEHNIRPEEIEQITAFTNDQTQMVCEPLEAKRKPQAIGDAKFSLPYTLAVAAIRRKVSLADYTLESIKDPQVLALAKR
jgi:2-methylcitrate dehydratase PrpD